MVMINRKVMQKLRETLKVTDQRIYQMIERIRRDKVVTKEIAAYVLAAQNKIDLSRYLDPNTLTDVRQVMGSAPVTIIRKVRPQSVPQKQIVLQLGKKLEIIDPNLPKKLLAEAEEMAKVYPIIYIFENSVRYFILKIMESKYGTDWWDNKVSREIREKVGKRLREEHRWHGRRGAHKIFYTDLGDLGNIIITNWQDFKGVLPTVAWITTRINEFELSRNIVEHNNPLPKREIDRLELYFGDWIRQITTTTLQGSDS